jgi:hypothetical protein
LLVAGGHYAKLLARVSAAEPMPAQPDKA